MGENGTLRMPSGIQGSTQNRVGIGRKRGYQSGYDHGVDELNTI